MNGLLNFWRCGRIDRPFQTMVVVALIAFAFTCFACDSADETEPSSTPGTQLEVELQVPTGDTPGNQAEFGLVITNIGTFSVALEIPGSRDNGFAGSVEFTIRDADGREVWTWPNPEEKEGLQGVATTVTLGPSEKLPIFSFGWDGLDNDEQPIVPGTYKVTAVLGARWADAGEHFTITSETKELEIS